MTDEPTKNPPEGPPSDTSGVGFAALRPPGQEPPLQPSQGIAPLASAPPPTPGPTPEPPGPVYQYDISRMPPNRGSGPSVLLIGAMAFILVLLVGAGALFALGAGPFARPTPGPTLSFRPRPTPTAGVITPKPSTQTGVPVTPEPTGVTPSATPIGDPKAALLSHIPDAIADTCTVTAPQDESTIVALALCDADEGNIKLTYFQYDSYDSMFTTYEGFRLASQIEPDSGSCSDHDTWPAEEGFNISGQFAGRWLCTEELGETSIYWTDNRLNILGQATQTEPDYTRFVQFWLHESGPDL